MPIKQAAKKALKSSQKKRTFNLARQKAMKEAIKKIQKLVAGGKKDEAKKMLPLAQKAIDKAQKRGVLKKNTASRKKSLLAKITK
ncbi:MAG: 30S ribosomal protein S20 [Candidatus Portnoybacteria bacterium CG10_big_fil_rev_8_21_14_0_10_44_7]|uniref:Small ribosomal subunit protein bS20 n=1 Tax=Candidatus Portnoybacteria bacterium CG10_big_fil_rev_8_21_14_0_10_44_7 TaxID=1974816 RepID=A0A2M8KI79_9BACT|nr:MAG: 30S ribosomal protein S20 [Candidatus Portnoybacteria bacterium CG10_big_fil_rev_8_21_14_0_10_44_7]